MPPEHKSHHATPILEVQDLWRVFRMDSRAVEVLRGISFQVTPAELVAVMGPSGSGKSTLLHLIGLLDRPTAGTIRIEGRDVSQLSAAALAALRRHKIGFVFQMFNLLPNLTAQQNVELPLVYSRWDARNRAARARSLLALLGMADRCDHRPDQLSGGERQRVAIARALATSPALILADEPTGNLDSQNTQDLLALLRQLREHLGITIILVTHDASAAETTDRILRMADGQIVEERRLSESASVGS